MKVKPVCYAVFDCNIFLQAAARSDSPAGECLGLAASGVVGLYTSEDILREISDVLGRPSIQRRFSHLTDNRIDSFLNKVRDFSRIVAKVPSKFRFVRDVDDEPYLNLAIKAKAEYIVTRDSDLLDLMTEFTEAAKDFRRRFRPLRIIGPSEFLKIVRQRDSVLIPRQQF